MIKDPYLPIVALAVVWGILTELVKHLFKNKDKIEDKTSITLEEIKSLISNVNLNIASLKSDLENNIYTTRGLQNQVSKLSDQVAALNIKVITYNQDKLTMTREINELKKILNKKSCQNL
jgi:chromosome segregation ATPase